MFDIIAEILATFFFVSVILFIGEPIAIGIALLAAIYFSSMISKASINPAVSVALFSRGDLTSMQLIWYILAELLGAGFAVLWYRAVGPTKK